MLLRAEVLSMGIVSRAPSLDAIAAMACMLRHALSTRHMKQNLCDTCREPLPIRRRARRRRRLWQRAEGRVGEALPDELRRVGVELEVVAVVGPEQVEVRLLRQPGLRSSRRVAARGAALRDVDRRLDGAVGEAEPPAQRARCMRSTEPLRYQGEGGF